MMIYYNFPGDSKEVIFFNIPMPVGYFSFSEETFHFYIIFKSAFFRTIIKRKSLLNCHNHVFEFITCDGRWYKHCFKEILPLK